MIRCAMTAAEIEKLWQHNLHCKKGVLNLDAKKSQISDLKRISVQSFTEFQTSF